MTDTATAAESQADETAEDASSTDGGRAALAGFVYQFLATAEESLRLLREGHNASEGRAERVVLAVHSEFADQDAAVEDSERRLELLQMKFSSDATRPFTVSEAKKIVSALRRSKTALAEETFEVSAYRLITNRTSREEAKRAFADIPNSWFTGSTAAVKREIRDAVEVTVVHADEAREALMNYLRQLGCAGSEPQDAVTQLVGKLLEEGASAAASTLTRARLHEILVGATDARTLESADCLAFLRMRVDNFAEDNGHPGPELFIPRPSLASRLTQLCHEHARVVVTGKGGVGKSAFLSQWGRDCIDTNKGAVVLEAVERVTSSSWFASQVSMALGMGAAHDRAREDDARTLARLGIVAEVVDARPVLFVALDAADEAPAALDIAKALWEQFRDLERAARRGVQPPVSLVVSCRDTDSHGMRSLLRSGPFPDSAPQGFDSLEVPNFDDEEVASLEAMLDGASGPTATDLLANVDSKSLTDVPPEVREALRHPIMWRFYSQFSAAVRNSIRRGEPGALREWAEKAIDWVSYRIEQRTRRGLRDRHVVEVLAAMGRAGVWDAQGRFEESGFRQSAITEGLDSLSVRDLLDQLESSGLIESLTSRTSRWTYSFIAELLAQGEGA